MLKIFAVSIALFLNTIVVGIYAWTVFGPKHHAIAHFCPDKHGDFNMCSYEKEY